MISLDSFSDITDTGTERNVIACAIKSSQAWLSASYALSSDDFTSELNKALWILIDSLRSKNVNVDPVTLYDALPPQYQKDIDDLGGWAYIQALQDLPIDCSNVDYQVGKLLELSTRRRIYSAGDKLKDISQDNKKMSEIEEDVEETFNSISKQKDEEIVNIGDNGLEFIKKRLANVAEVPGISTGFPHLDVIIQGLQPGRLYVVGAPQKTGKSMLLLNWAKHICIDNQIPILWISTEHSIDDEFSRLLSLTSEVPEQTINNGTFSTMDVYSKKVSSAYDKITKSPFNFVSMPFFTPDKIGRVARYMARVHGIKALFFDFIKSNEEGSDKEYMKLGVLAYSLKSLAMQEDIPVITASQVNRAGKENFKINGDMDSDYFAGSDRITHACSVSFVLRPPAPKENPNPEYFRVLKITDNRHGQSGRKFLLDFQGEVIKMEENSLL